MTTTLLNEDQKAKARARRSARVTERRVSGASAATATNKSVSSHDDDRLSQKIAADADNKVIEGAASLPGRDALSASEQRRLSSTSNKSAASGGSKSLSKKNKKKSTTAPTRNASNGSVSVLSIDEDGEFVNDGDYEDEDEEENLAIVAVPTMLYSQESSKAGSTVSSNVAASVSSQQGTGQDDITDTETGDVEPTELARNTARDTPMQPGAMRVVPSHMLNSDGAVPMEEDLHDSRAKLDEDEDIDEETGMNPVSNSNNSNADLVDAELIDEEADRRRLQETLEGVLHSQDAIQVVDVEAEDKLKRERQRRNLLIYLGIGIVLTVVIVTVVVVSLQKAQESLNPPTEMPSSSPTMAPTTRISAVQMYIEDKFEVTIPHIEDFASMPAEEFSMLPRARAIQWLTEEDTTTTFPFESEEDEYAFYDRYVAVVFAYSTAYTAWNDNTNWLNGTVSTCDWFGLSCNDDGRISVIDLASQNLRGTIPSEIGFLEDLDFVFLFRNELTGTIPTEMGKLGDVDFMYLNENQLTGTLPDELSGLLDADDLFLFGNQFTGTIPESFGQLIDVVNLYMHDNRLTGSIPSSLSQLKRLQRLYLNNNELSGEIPTEISGIIGMERLQLQFNNLSGTIPAELGNFLALAVLQLQGNNLVGDMPQEICDHRDLLIDDLEILEADCEDVNCPCCTNCDQGGGEDN
mmetsp:Transcript_281/g.470  ORF Transcript_281/g.470 Transcript_281/m.470 type:complete len:691 (+) Transcript_281:409-2481(+)